jgi:hypothetical protein
MADYTKTVAESLRVFGSGPSTKWGTYNDYVMTWGVDKWGYGSEDSPQQVMKVIGESVSGADTIGRKDFSYLLTSEYVTLVDNMAKETSVTLTSETISASDAPRDVYLQNGMYYYNFISNTIDAEERDIATYTQTATPSTIYTQTTNPSDPWS